MMCHHRRRRCTTRAELSGEAEDREGEPRPGGMNGEACMCLHSQGSLRVLVPHVDYAELSHAVLRDGGLAGGVDRALVGLRTASGVSAALRAAFRATSTDKVSTCKATGLVKRQVLIHKSEARSSHKSSCSCSRCQRTGRRRHGGGGCCFLPRAGRAAPTRT